MGWWSRNIMGGDTPWDFEDLIYDVVGKEKYPERPGVKPADQERVNLTKEDFDSQIDNIEKEILDFAWSSDATDIGYQVLGYMMMEAGGNLEGELKTKIINACKNDSRAAVDQERKEVMDRMIKQIQEYKNIATPNPDQDYGVFAAIANKLGKE